MIPAETLLVVEDDLRETSDGMHPGMYVLKKHSKTALQFILQHTVHYVKVFISAVSDLLGFFFHCQNQITKTGGLWL